MRKRGIDDPKVRRYRDEIAYMGYYAGQRSVYASGYHVLSDRLLAEGERIGLYARIEKRDFE
jgi:hypothetical protein